MILGITGGIGAGKSTVLKILEEKYHFIIFDADSIAHELMMSKKAIYNKILKCFGNNILLPDGNIDRKKLGVIVFHDKLKLEQLNNIVHPAVISEILYRIETIQSKNKEADFVIEAALLIESGCYKICDHLWYVYSNSKTRNCRLKKDRGYTDEKINSIVSNQLKKEEFLKYADDVIDNSFTLEETQAQIEKKLELLRKV